TAVPAALLSAFTSASWIWAPESAPPNAPPGDAALRFTYTPPAGKTPASATIVATVDDRFTLYANGALVGSAPNTTDIWMQAQIFRGVPLSGANVLFAVRGTNLPDVSTGGAGPAGLLFAAQVTFTDGSSALVTSSTAWKATASIPANFQSPATSDADWPAALSLGAYGVAPWDTQVVVANPTPALPALASATWVWNSAAPSAPAGDVAFRRTLPAPAGKSAVSATVVLTADDTFSFWVNGALVGAAPNETDVWMTAQQFTDIALNASTNVFAVRATNRADVTSGGPSPAGLLVSASVLYSDGSSAALVSDASWKASADIPDGWEAVGFDDSKWAAAVSEGAYGVQPWG
ncbi:hypothetical protein FB451DRAFT_983914, partial [Mycena latifolia]